MIRTLFILGFLLISCVSRNKFVYSNIKENQVGTSPVFQITRNDLDVYLNSSNCKDLEFQSQQLKKWAQNLGENVPNEPLVCECSSLNELNCTINITKIIPIFVRETTELFPARIENHGICWGGALSGSRMFPCVKDGGPSDFFELQFCKEIRAEDLSPGDIIIFDQKDKSASHIAIFVSDALVFNKNYMGIRGAFDNYRLLDANLVTNLYKSTNYYRCSLSKEFLVNELQYTIDQAEFGEKIWEIEKKATFISTDSRLTITAIKNQLNELISTMPQSTLKPWQDLRARASNFLQNINNTYFENACFTELFLKTNPKPNFDIIITGLSSDKEEDRIKSANTIIRYSQTEIEGLNTFLNTKIKYFDGISMALHLVDKTHNFTRFFSDAQSEIATKNILASYFVLCGAKSIWCNRTTFASKEISIIVSLYLGDERNDISMIMNNFSMIIHKTMINNAEKSYPFLLDLWHDSNSKNKIRILNFLAEITVNKEVEIPKKVREDAGAKLIELIFNVEEKSILESFIDNIMMLKSEHGIDNPNIKSVIHKIYSTFPDLFNGRKFLLD